MISALKIVGGQVAFLLKQATGKQLLSAELNKKIYLKSYVERVNAGTKWKALREAVAWLKVSQDAMADDGFGTFYLQEGWTSSYPETSGYIVPTLLKYSEIEKDDDAEERARKCLDWLLNIQKPSGGWQSGYVHQNRPEIVFNTGQVIRGMLAGYQHFKDEKYLLAAAKAADWLVAVQLPDGSFGTHVYMDVARVYDSYVVAPVLELNAILPKPEYVQMATKNIDWILREKQNAAGWFADCDNTVAHNHAPIIHTIAYTIDGILDCALLLKRQDYADAAIKPAKKLAEIFLKNGMLNGRYDEKWNGSQDLITTGAAQLAIIWHKLYLKTGDEMWHEAQQKMNSLLVSIQQRHVPQPPETKGAQFGSFPFWGRYERFGCPNWATKYFADSLMLEVKEHGAA